MTKLERLFLNKKFGRNKFHNFDLIFQSYDMIFFFPTHMKSNVGLMQRIESRSLPEMLTGIDSQQRLLRARLLTSAANKKLNNLCLLSILLISLKYQISRLNSLHKTDATFRVLLGKKFLF